MARRQQAFIGKPPGTALTGTKVLIGPAARIYLRLQKLRHSPSLALRGSRVDLPPYLGSVVRHEQTYSCVLGRLPRRAFASPRPLHVATISRQELSFRTIRRSLPQSACM